MYVTILRTVLLSNPDVNFKMLNLSKTAEQ